MAAANLGPGSGIRWGELLRRALPEVDIFLPSLDEAAHLLGRNVARDAAGRPDLESVAALAETLLDHGVAVAGIKLGEHGLYVRTAADPRIAALSGPVGPGWARRELHSSVFETDVVGTTGAGDATIAGFLFGLVRGWSPEATIAAACAVGGASTEAADGTSGIPPWPELETRLAGGWRQVATPAAPGWRAARAADAGLMLGPRDAVTELGAGRR
jgi:sugar/nucleoside kinase (ribokinase family)